MKKLLFATLLTVILGFSTLANALPLESRDGGKMYYDPNLNITWLTEPNNTPLIWDEASKWAEGLNIDGITGWRLPTTPDIVLGGEGEMWYLYYHDLGNVAGGPLSNKGPFTDLQPYSYWTGTEYLFSNHAWFFSFDMGWQDAANKYFPMYALAVRPGDVSGIPEPTTMLLLCSGLIGLAGYGRKKFFRK
jgi:hypothetical protein